MDEARRLEGCEVLIGLKMKGTPRTQNAEALHGIGTVTLVHKSRAITWPDEIESKERGCRSHKVRSREQLAAPSRDVEARLARQGQTRPSAKYRTNRSKRYQR